MTLPAIRFGAIERGRLLPGDGEEPTPVTLVRAPYGYGKTTFVTQWMRRERARGVDVVWVRAPQEPDGAEKFWRAVREQIESQNEQPGARDALGNKRVIASGLGDRATVERAIAGLERPAVLVIDDYQHVTAPDLDLDVAALPGLSEHLSVVVSATRFAVLEGPLVTSQMSVGIVDAKTLAFTADELDELAAARGIDPNTVPRFAFEITEGWPAALSLVLNELERERAREAHEGVLVRFAKQLLKGIDEPNARRVFSIVVLCENISAEMLVGSAGRTPVENAVALRALEERGLVERRWFASGSRYRCHPGFARLFEQPALAELGAESAKRLRRVHALNLSLDDADAAIVQLMSIRDYQAAERLLTTNFLFVVEPETRFFQAIQRVPLTDLKPYRVLTAALSLISMVDPRTPRTVLDRAYEQLRQTALGDLSSGEADVTVVSLAALIVAERMRGSGAEVLRLSRDLEMRLVHSEDGSLAPLRNIMSFLHSVVGLSSLISGDLELAERSYLRVLEWAEECDNESEQVRAWSGLALTAAFNGDPVETRERLERGEQMARNTGFNGPQLSWVNRVAAKALLAVEDLDEPAMEQVFESVDAVFQRIEQGAVLIWAEAQLVRMVRGEQAAIERLRERSMRLNPVFRSTTYLRALLASLRAELRTYLGGYEGAQRLLEQLPQEFEGVAVASARLALYRGELNEARRLAQRSSQRVCSAGHRNDMDLISAIAAWEQGEAGAAIEHLAPVALRVRDTAGIAILSRVPFDSLLALTTAACERDEGDRRFADLLIALGRLPEPMRSTRIEQLSRAEERTLLALRGEGTTAQIAEELFVTQNTVKFHLRSVYRKLGVSSRAQAVSRAADMGLFDVIEREE